MRNRFGDNERSLRDQIFEVLGKSKTSPQEDLAALFQCATHIRNRLLIETTARECGLKLSRFQMNDALELYYDLKQGRDDVGFISKGWDDPGFRVGSVVEVPKWKLDAVKDHTYGLLKYCATRGIVLTVETKDDVIEYQMGSVIYSDGFNTEVFVQVLRSLNECTDKANELLS